MSEFTEKEIELLKNKLKYVREQEHKYGQIGIQLRSKNKWVRIGRNFFGTALGTSGLVSLISNFTSGDIMNIITSALALSGGIYNLVFDGLDYDTKVQNFLKTSGEFHNLGERLEYILVDDDINKDDILSDIQARIKDIDDSAIPL